VGSHGEGSKPLTGVASGQALVAQLAEHFLGKEEVTGSIPVKGSRTSRR
jgi:hypothetical protein